MSHHSRALGLVLLGFTLFSSRTEADSKMTINTISFLVEHQPDGKKYRSYVKEQYELTPGHLRYSAYFGGMPMEMNHMDSVEWKTDGEDASVFLVALELSKDTSTGLVIRPDSAPSPTGGNGIYLVHIETSKSSSTRSVEDQKSKAWLELNAAFQKLLARFEKSTGRPLTVGQLPQRRDPDEEVATALQRAVTAANRALDQAYALFSKQPGVVAPARKTPWVDAAGVQRTGDLAKGFTFTWTHFAPSGYEFETVVTVSPSHDVQVSKASAQFSPD
jgi:hypothetical protein